MGWGWAPADAWDRNGSSGVQSPRCPSSHPPLQVQRLSPKPSPHTSPQVTAKTVQDRGHTPPAPPPIPPLPADMDTDGTPETTRKFPKPSELKGSNLKSLENFSNSTTKDKSPETTRKFPKPSELKGSNLKSLEKFSGGTTSQRKDTSPETARKFPKPSELKGSNLKSLEKFSGGTTSQGKVAPAPVTESPHSGGSPRFGTRVSPSHSAAVQNRTPNGTIETKTSNEGSKGKLKPPLPSKDTAKIKDLVNRFEKSKPTQAGNASVAGNSATNAKPDLPPPKKPAANHSPPTGRRRNDSGEFQHNKLRDEWQAQPSNSEDSRHVPSSESQPSLPPRLGAGLGAGPGRVQWQRKQIEPSEEPPSR